ncbi:MAG: hypothetical protein IK078_04435 [Lachnospiraceae bacterium]|nr:hypothetical protein [Lachnospiraceae bacterium]
MSLYLVDYENTGVRGIAGIEQLRPMDRLIILYGPKTGSVPFEDMVRITSSPAAVEFVRTTKTAKNYLDFQLTTYLGYLIAQRSDDEYVIVSRDSGFDSCVDFWTEREIKIIRVNNLARETGEDNTPKKSAGRSRSSKGNTKTATAANTAQGAQGSDAKESGKNNKKSEPKKKSGQPEKNPEQPAGKKSGRGRKQKNAEENPPGDFSLDELPFDVSGFTMTEDESSFMFIPDSVEDLPFELEPVQQSSGRDQKKTDSGRKNGRKAGTDSTAKKKKAGNNAGANASAPSNQKTDEKKAAAANVQGGDKQPTVPESIKKKVRNALKAEGLQPGAYRKLYACMLESNDKSTLNTSLVHAFGQETANRYYKQILTAFTAWRNLS